MAVTATVAAITTAVVRRCGSQAAEWAPETGAAPDVFAAVRLLGAGPWRGRWRHGYATVQHGEIRWRPRWPRPGPAVELRDVAIGGRPRRSEWYESWWLAPGVRIYRVIAADRPADQFELAVVSESTTLFESVLAGRKPTSSYDNS